MEYIREEHPIENEVKFENGKGTLADKIKLRWLASKGFLYFDLEFTDTFNLEYIRTAYENRRMEQ